MRAVILNSGSGSRMGALTADRHKSMVALPGGESLLARQVRILSACGVSDFVVTTGPYAAEIERHLREGFPGLSFRFVHSDRSHDTNYIYSLYLAREWLQGDILLLHGDLVFERGVAEGITALPHSAMAVSASLPLPDKDFKAVVQNGKIVKVGVEYFGEGAVAAQPFYRLAAADWLPWLRAIERYIGAGKVTCYAEVALCDIADGLDIRPFDFGTRLCAEVDTPEDLAAVSARLRSAAI